MKMTKILVPVDFSDYSEYALEVASTIAKQQNAEIVVLHMLGLSEAVYDNNESQGLREAQYYMKLAKKRFQPFLDKEYLLGVKVRKIVQNFKLFSEINEVAKDHQIDLVVMGSHGTNGAKAFFVGSNTEKVVRTSEIPVLVIKERILGFNIKRMVMAWHFEDELAHSFKKAKDIANAFSAKLNVVYINTPGDAFLTTSQLEAKISRSIGDMPKEFEVIIYDDINVEIGIINYANKINADLVVVPTHGRKGLSHFVMGSLGEDVANHAKLPVLTFLI